ncbi:MAG: DNA integrity scanning diadenylate cyclase DisA [Clostridiales bacterium]
MNREAGKYSVMHDALEMVAPGTTLREGIENILKAKTGGLVVIGDGPDIKAIVEGGFIINTAVNEARLYELAKMDGAIILDAKAEHIWRANTQLQPTKETTSDETGIRHRVASRVAVQTSAIVIAISQRRSMITIYRGNKKFILSDIGTLLAKANQALQTLERYCHELRKELDNLSLLEFDDAVLVNDVVKLVQRGERVKRIAKELEYYLLQMGDEGTLIRMQMEELTSDIWAEYYNVLLDYANMNVHETVISLEEQLAKLNDDDLMDKPYIAKLLGIGNSSDILEQCLTRKGYRILQRVPRIPASIVAKIVDFFDNDLQKILHADIDQLDEVEGVGIVRSNAIHQSLIRQRDYAIFGAGKL